MSKLRAGIKAITKIQNWPTYFMDFMSLVNNRDIVYVFHNKLKFFARGNTSDRGIMTSIVLSDEHKIQDLKLPKNAVVIDIGAHIGIFSVYVSKKVKRVYAYEPEPENYKYLQKNIEINKLKNKIIPFNLAVSDKKEKIRIFYSDNNTGGHSRYRKSGKHIDIAALPLKDIIENNKLRSIDLLKIDTEGSEYKIIFGLPKKYFKKIKRMIVEYHDIKHKKYNKENLIKFLKKQGYTIKGTEGYLFCSLKPSSK